MKPQKRTPGRPRLSDKGVQSVTFIMPTDEIKRLRKQAKDEGKTLSEVIRKKLAA